jgi:ubiquinone/menaquinone biosynthesis C-methylase UbiE
MVGQLFRFCRLLMLPQMEGKSGIWAEIKPLLRNRFLTTKAARKRKENSSPPLLFQMASAYWLSQAIYVAAKLGIADLLKDGPQTCGALATETRSDAQSLFRLMRALSGQGIFSQVGHDSFALSPLADGIQTKVPGSLRATVITLGEIHYQACGDLLHSVQSGSPAFNKVFGASLFEYLKQNADAADAFNQGMSSLSSMLAYAVLLAYDFSGITSIVDIGGGEGKLLEKILEFYPSASGIVFDTPPTIERAGRQLCNDQTRSRCSYAAGDFFDAVPQGADAYLLCGVVHDWDDTRAVQILKHCRRAMAKSGRVLLLETVVPETDSMHFSKLLDLNMLVMTGGRERTKAEFRTLLDAADYKLTRIIGTMAPQSLIEAVPK